MIHGLGSGYNNECLKCTEMYENIAKYHSKIRDCLSVRLFCTGAVVSGIFSERPL